MAPCWQGCCCFVRHQGIALQESQQDWIYFTCRINTCSCPQLEKSGRHGLPKFYSDVHADKAGCRCWHIYLAGDRAQGRCIHEQCQHQQTGGARDQCCAALCSQRCTELSGATLRRRLLEQLTADQHASDLCAPQGRQGRSARQGGKSSAAYSGHMRSSERLSNAQHRSTAQHLPSTAPAPWLSSGRT